MSPLLPPRVYQQPGLSPPLSAGFQERDQAQKLCSITLVAAGREGGVGVLCSVLSPAGSSGTGEPETRCQLRGSRGSLPREVKVSGLVMLRAG